MTKGKLILVVIVIGTIFLCNFIISIFNPKVEVNYGEVLQCRSEYLIVDSQLIYGADGEPLLIVGYEFKEDSFFFSLEAEVISIKINDSEIYARRPYLSSFNLFDIKSFQIEEEDTFDLTITVLDDSSITEFSECKVSDIPLGEFSEEKEDIILNENVLILDQYSFIASKSSFMDRQTWDVSFPLSIYNLVDMSVNIIDLGDDYRGALQYELNDGVYTISSEDSTETYEIEKMIR